MNQSVMNGDYSSCWKNGFEATDDPRIDVQLNWGCGSTDFDFFFAETIQGVVDLKFNESNGCETLALLHWEQLHSVQLPQEIKRFSLATSGFQLTWKFRLAGN